MLKVIIEMWPYGNEERKHVLDSFEIINTGRGTSTTGEYVIRKNKKILGRVRGFPRKQKSARNLLYRALVEIEKQKVRPCSLED